MAISKVERLLNLVIALLSTSQFLTAEKIRSSVAGYDESGSFEAFSRMFERDKTELRELGIPLEVGLSPRYGGAEGYRINRDDYEFPEIDLDSDEAATVAVAVQMWESPELTAAAQSALVKLRAAGVQVDQDPPVAVSTAGTGSRGSESALGKLLTAIDAGRAVRFEHRSAPTAPPTRRDVEPWGVVTDRGRWYLVGHDRDRDATRTFRLSRIGDDVQAYGPANTVHKPDAVNLRETVEQFTATTPISGTATVWVADSRAHDIRRIGRLTGDHTVGFRSGTLFEVPVRSWDWLARIIAGHGPDALVLQPAELRGAVVERLRAAVDATDTAGTGGTAGTARIGSGR